MKTMIFGHKKPDTDSVMAAISLSYLENKCGNDTEPRLLGSVNKETKIFIPQGIQSGEKIRIPGKGYKNNDGTTGDLIAEVKIMVPKQLTIKEREMFEELDKISKFNPRSTKNI